MGVLSSRAIYCARPSARCAVAVELASSGLFANIGEPISFPCSQQLGGPPRPPFYILRGLGLVTYSALVLWGLGLFVMWHWKTPQELHESPAPA